MRNKHLEMRRRIEDTKLAITDTFDDCHCGHGP